MDTEIKKIKILTDELKTTLESESARLDSVKKTAETADAYGATISGMQNDISSLRTNLSDVGESVTNNISTIGCLTTRIDALESSSSGTNDVCNLADAIMRADDVAEEDTLEQKLEKVTNRINSLQSQITAITPEHDLYYIGNSYSDYPAGTILKTYDYYERTLGLSTVNYVTLPTAYFCAEVGAEGTIKVSLNYQVNQASNLIIRTYNNNELINSESIEITNPDVMQEYHLSVLCSLNTESKGNAIKIVCSISPTTSTTLSLTKMKIELLAPNADLIQTLPRIDVESINGTYYITDCSNDSAKLGIITNDSIANISNVSFTDLGIPAQKMVVGTNMTGSGVNWELNHCVYCYQNNKAKNICRDSVTNSEVTWSLFDKAFDWENRQNARTYFLTVNGSFKPCFYIADADCGSISTTTISCPYDNVVVFNAFKQCNDIHTTSSAYHPMAIVSADGDVIIYSNAVSTAPSYNLGYGTNIRAFYTRYTSTSNYDVSVFVKRFDKIVRYEFTYSGFAFTLNNTTELGTYEDYFKGTNSDYFVVKNGELKYFKSQE